MVDGESVSVLDRLGVEGVNRHVAELHLIGLECHILAVAGYVAGKHALVILKRDVAGRIELRHAGRDNLALVVDAFRASLKRKFLCIVHCNGAGGGARKLLASREGRIVLGGNSSVDGEVVAGRDGCLAGRCNIAESKVVLILDADVSAFGSDSTSEFVIVVGDRDIELRHGVGRGVLGRECCILGGDCSKRLL